MKKAISVLCILCLLFTLASVSAEGAVPRFQFQLTVVPGFQGREARVRVQLINPKSVGHAVDAELRDEDGNVLATKKFSNNEFKNMYFIVPDDWLGAKYLSIWADGVKVSEEDCFFAADDLDNKSVVQVGLSEKRIAITLDCAYGDTYTDELLDILDEYGVKVTFFVTGQWAEGYPEHLLDFISRGHEIGNHTYYHPHLPDQTYERILREIARTSDAVEAVTGIRPTLFRPPYGETNQYIRAISRAAGCEHIFWTESSRDANERYDLDMIIERVTKKVEPGYIYLFHNGGKYTADALRVIIPYFQELGYEMVTVSDLLSASEFIINADDVSALSE